jgi:hypothetical protein
VIFGVSQEEHLEKPGLFVEHRQAPPPLEAPVLLQARRVDLRAPDTQDHDAPPFN